MISLQDEIKKFENLVYNPQIEEFVTVDQMFVGGGITMESIIQESNFIVEELKKMNAVFRNYCKLNDKVYQKITEHELSVHSEQARLNSVVASIDRKLEDALKKFKQIHEDTLIQNQKSHNAITEHLEPIRQQLQQKVDQSTFSNMVKKFLEDNQDESGEGGNQSNQEGGEAGEGGRKIGQGGAVGSDRQPGSPYPRKKGKVSYDQFYRFRDELDKLMKTSDDQLVNISQDSSEAKTMILKYIPQINSISTQLSETRTAQYKLETSQMDNFNSMTKQVKNLHAQLNSRLNDQVWNNKFQQFNDKQIRPAILKLEESLRFIETKSENNQEQNIKKFKQLDAETLKNKTDIVIHHRDIQNIKGQVSTLSETIEDNRKTSVREYEQIMIKLQAYGQQSRKSLATFAGSTQKEIKQIQNALASIVQTVQQSVVKVVSKRFDYQLKMIDKNIRQNSEATRQVRIDIGILEEELRNIKNVLSQKANFSDIVLHVEKKADKEDFRELQHKMHETSQQYITKQMNQSINISRFERSQSMNTRKVPSINKISNSKTLFAQTPQRSERMDLDSGTKMFMCGMEGHLADIRKPWSQTSRRRGEKSASTVLATDFML